MAIRREPMQAKQFVQIPNHWARDPRLSCKALGLMVYITSHAEDYDLTVSQIIRQKADGECAIRSAVKELEDLGYLVRHRERKHGRWCQYDYQIVEFPQVDTTRDFQGWINQAGGSSVEDQGLRTPRENTNEERSSRDEGIDAEQPKSGEGRDVRKGTPKVGEVDGWPLVVLPGEGLNGTRWADRLYERE